MYTPHKRKAKMKWNIKRSKRLLYIIAISAVILLSLFLTLPLIMNEGGTSTKPKAAIIDALIHYPNRTFVDEATKILSDAGFEVDYISHEEVTVDLYKSLPSLGYKFLIFRVHCGPLIRRLQNGTVVPGDDAILFTAETYLKDKYLSYQRNGQLAMAKIIGRDEVYFAVPPWFFDQCAEGRFQDTIVILDSCYGFYSSSMAEAFVRRGAKVFIGWDGEVQASHTDSAVIILLSSLLIDGLTVKQSVDKVMENAGPDPYYGSVMLFYPPDVGDYHVNIEK